MARTGSRFATFLLTLVLVSAPCWGAPGSPDDDSDLGGHRGAVTARLVADVVAVAPGDTFQLGIEITMGPGWHTYWENGGDAGLPTTVTWALPEGFEAGEILWPVPHRYEEEGDLVTFGYADRTLLLTDVTLSESVSSGQSVPIGAQVDWLQCKDICIPGAAELSILVPVDSSTRPAPAEVLRSFERSRALLPHPAPSLANVGVHPFQSLDPVPAGETAEIAVVFSGLAGFETEHSEFFPQPSGELWFRDATFKSDGENLGLVIPVEIDEAVEPGSVLILPGVARIARGKEEPWLVSFEIPVTVAESDELGRPSEAAVFASQGGRFLASAGAPSPGGGAIGVRALLEYLLLAFLGGIILNVMPCVLPVISLKILGFVSKADEDPRRVSLLGWTFAAGVLVSFLILAGFVIALQAAGEHVGWGFQFQNPVFVAGLSIVIFIFALSLLGVFEIGVTLSTTLGLGMLAAERKDYADAFFHGILTTILATPCTAPMLGTAIAFAFSQPAWVILLVFTAVAFGLALPYVLLSMNPAWLKYVPRPGPWMETFKQAMGFLLLATLVWLLSVFGAQMGSPGVIWLLAFLLVLGILGWIHGQFLSLMAGNTRRIVIWAVTIVSVVWSYKGFLHERLFPGPEVAAMTELAPGMRSKVEVTEHGTRWEPFSVDTLDAAVSDGRTVFIDFTAEWCWTCKVNEKTVLADAEVEDLFRENRVLTLKGDWTRKDPEITEILKKHNRAGVPFYAIYPAGRPTDVIVLPEIINKKLVLESLKKAGPSLRDSDA